MCCCPEPEGLTQMEVVWLVGHSWPDTQLPFSDCFSFPGLALSPAPPPHYLSPRSSVVWAKKLCVSPQPEALPPASSSRQASSS